MSITHYFLSYHLRKHVTFDNTKPHCMNAVPSFYLNCKNVYDQYHETISQKPPTQYYNTLINNSVNNIDREIPRLVLPFTSKHIFPILHLT